MQYRPTAPELLTALADLLEATLLPALPPELRHQARVGAHLARMIERELTLPAVSADVADADSEERLWEALVAQVRADLAVAKPGYDAWEGE
ncbi:hypothetical protein GPX89_41910 [Nocardia sp. ET3-3]|uniref:Uncharacterized protein n=2 Tax=Nocardia terrae TaxID=2675851 RepID=A0A7K1VBC5_9NOCA|nr:hypothetical protein [Nocardia terrae]